MGTRYSLVVLSDTFAISHPLPAIGRCELGRDPECDLCIPDPSLSRRHAVLDLTSEAIWLTDLGSRNGTIIESGALEPHVPTEVEPRTVFSVGAVTLSIEVQSLGPRRHVWSRLAFDLRLTEECERALRSTTQFALLRVATPEWQLVQARLPVHCVSGEYAQSEHQVLWLIDSVQVEVFCESARRIGARIASGATKFPSLRSVSCAQQPNALISRCPR